MKYFYTKNRGNQKLCYIFQIIHNNMDLLSANATFLKMQEIILPRNLMIEIKRNSNYSFLC